MECTDVWVKNGRIVITSSRETISSLEEAREDNKIQTNKEIDSYCG